MESNQTYTTGTDQHVVAGSVRPETISAPTEKYEYYVVSMKQTFEEAANGDFLLNRLGQEGWVMTGVLKDWGVVIYYFARKIG